MKSTQKMYCGFFYERKEAIPYIEDVIKKLNEHPEIYIIKRFPNDMNHELYKSLEKGDFDI
jgi:hypothetical protein